MLHIITIIFIMCTLGLVWCTIKVYTIYDYWKSKNVYTWKPIFLFGNSKDVVLQKIPLGFDVTELYSDLKRRSQKFGGYYNLLTPVFIPVDLDLIKQILISNSDHFINRVSHVDEENDPLSLNLVHSNGEKWKKLRSKTTPSFTTSKMKQFFPVMMEQINNLIQLIEKDTQNRRSLNIKEVLERYMIEVIGLYTCATNFNTTKCKDSSLQRQLTEFYNTSIFHSLVRYLITTPELLKIFKIKTFNKRTTDFFFKLMNDIIEQQDKRQSKTTAVLDALLQYQSREGGHKELTRNEIISNITFLLLVGYDSTTNMLTFCLYELARDSKLQEALRLEINQLSKNPSFEDVSSLSLLSSCINETLRKYTASTIETRVCTKTFHVPHSDIILEKGTHVYIPVRGIHWDPEYYPDPEQFDPKRFLEECSNKRHPCTWLPFGIGPRHCIGYKLALLDMKIVLISLLKNFKFSLNPKTDFPMRYDPTGFTLQPKNDVLLNVQKV